MLIVSLHNLVLEQFFFMKTWRRPFIFIKDQ